MQGRECGDESGHPQWQGDVWLRGQHQVQVRRALRRRLQGQRHGVLRLVVGGYFPPTHNGGGKP